MLSCIFCEVNHIYRPSKSKYLVKLCKLMRLAPVQPKSAQENFSPTGQISRENGEESCKCGANSLVVEPSAGRNES